VEALRVRSCLIDGKAIAFETDGLASFELSRGGRHDHALCAFALIKQMSKIWGGANRLAQV
jgi:hypothetical protein